jgi:starch phosphorylase
MAHLAVVGSHVVNGVAALHSDLLRQRVFRDFFEMWPERFHNVTNGVTPRRFIGLINPGLSSLFTRIAGDGWLSDLTRLRALEPVADDPSLQEDWRQVKHANKAALAEELRRRTGVLVDPATLFDVQVKRIHEYKRQLLNILHALTLVLRLRNGTGDSMVPRTIIFGGKAAPGYRMAKLIIRLIHGVAEAVAADPACRGRLSVVFIPDYNVKNSQRVFPAAELSEQISTAGMEASGTGNMKLAMNGALTIGTLDGANVEIREAVGHENFFLFGLTADQVAEVKASHYRPGEIVERDAELSEVLAMIAKGEFAQGDVEMFSPVVGKLTGDDPFLVLADYRAYVECQDRVANVYRDAKTWTRMSILNSARMEYFSSDRAVADYCRDVWGVAPQPATGPRDGRGRRNAASARGASR